MGEESASEAAALCPQTSARYPELLKGRRGETPLGSAQGNWTGSPPVGCVKEGQSPGAGILP